VPSYNFYHTYVFPSEQVVSVKSKPEKNRFAKPLVSDFFGGKKEGGVTRFGKA
jgi:hypothetical protein